MTGARFDHRDAGTPESAWAGLLDRVRELAVPRSTDRIVVVAAHPDDETLGAGGLIALASAAGAAVCVLVATDGERSHQGSPTHSPDDLAGRRRREVYAAVAALAPGADVQLLGLPDGRLAEHRDELAAAICTAAADCTHLVTPWIGDRHPDHEACARAAVQAAAQSDVRHWQYPIWAWHWADPDTLELRMPGLCGLRLDSAAHAAKLRAMDCHVSQHRPLSDAEGDEPILSAEMLEHFSRDVEAFIVASATDATPRDYFTALYERADDPWGLQERFYEQRKRAALLAALTKPRFRRAFEPGCATGLLTNELAQRCDQLVAWDTAGAAVAQTAARLQGAEHVSVAEGHIPDEWPDGVFDLIVLSEVGYYCADLAALASRVDASLADDGVLVACHWRHDAPMHPHTAGAVHAVVGAGHQLVVSHVEDDFLLQVWTRTGLSVAASAGIVT